MNSKLNKTINSTELLQHLRHGSPLIDVRAPIEFQQGHLPGAINLPLLNNEERAEVGTCYKQFGQEAAIQKGHQLISGAIKKNRLDSWIHFLKNNPSTLVYCFRGGLRSQTVQAWLAEMGYNLPILKGGYKGARQKLLEEMNQFCEQNQFIVISGRTGSHKTVFLQNISAFYPTLDLEGLAHHRGSAFGGYPSPQPHQANFENQLSLCLIKSDLKNKLLAVEDESRMIGKVVQPESVFNRLRASDLVYLDENLENRTQNILFDYVQEPLNIATTELATPSLFEGFRKATKNISKKLGGLRTEEVLKSLNQAEQAYLTTQDLEPNREWIRLLLLYYYDPLYDTSLERRQPRIVFKGNPASVNDYFQNL